MAGSDSPVPDTDAPPSVELKHDYAEVNGLRLHYVEAGSGPLVVLLHGFPDFWASWQAQIPALATAGFRVVAPDMRGYGLSDKPQGWRAYAVGELADDVAGLITRLGADEAAVVGHDWGAAVAYYTAMKHPVVVERLAILNVPHPERMLLGLRTLKQLRKSWYMFFFQLPRLPEAAFRWRRFGWARQSLGRAGDMSDADFGRYVEAWSQPGALTGMINYYRAALRRSPRKALEQLRTIEAPVLVIWGQRDPYLGEELAAPLPQWVPHVRVERLPEAGHFVHWNSPARVNQLLIEFLTADREEAANTGVR